MSHVLSEWLLALEVRRKHVRIHGILTRGCAVALVILLVVGASVEVRRTLVLCCAAMLSREFVLASSAWGDKTALGGFLGQWGDSRRCI